MTRAEIELEERDFQLASVSLKSVVETVWHQKIHAFDSLPVIMMQNKAEACKCVRNTYYVCNTTSTICATCPPDGSGGAAVNDGVATSFAMRRHLQLSHGLVLSH